MSGLAYLKPDCVFIENLELNASIGVFDWEKTIKQRLVFNLELFTDFSKAAISDDIVDAVNYALVCEEIKHVLSRQHYDLLEYLAERISEHLLAKFQISGLLLSISKPEAVAETHTVGVRILRHKDHASV